ncbi:MAG: cell division protein ZapA [Burkholderiales bacterium]|nr:cell division protein ZapA [Burkholderiales bacterium]
MKQLEVQIMGQTYLLGCPEGGDARLLEAVERVDTAMCKIRDAGKVRARDRIAVLAALNLAFDVPERAPSAPTVPALSTDAVAASLSPDSNVLLVSLLERLDEALGEDGRFPHCVRVAAPPRGRLSPGGGPAVKLHQQRLYNLFCLQCRRALYFLEPMLIEPGLGILPC